MADNVTLDPGVGGATCATDDVGGVHFQKVKLDVGGDGLTVPVVGALPISAAALPLPTGAATEATLGTVHGHVDSIDGKMTACNTGAVTVAASALPADAATQTTLALIKAKTDNIPADPSKESGLLATINAKLVSGTDIGDVTVNNAAGAAAVNIQDGGNTISVDGTVAVTNADITSIKTAVELLDNAVDGNYLNVNENIAGTDVAAGAGAVGAQVQRMTLASDDPAVTALQIIDNMISGNEGQVDVVAALPAGSNLIGDVAIGPRTTGGATPYSYISDGTDLVSVTDGQSTLYAITCTSTDATVIYLKIYDKATAPDPSAETPVLRFAVPSMATGAGFVWSVPQGMNFANGIGFALVTGAADTDETAVTANEVMVNLVYKH